MKDNNLKLLSVSLTAPQWNVLEVALDRYIDDQLSDAGEDALVYARKAGIVKALLQHELTRAGAG
mgnify:CR=1 FL=1